MKKILQALYEVLANFYIKKDGKYDAGIPFLGACFIGLMLGLFIANISGIISLVTKNPMIIHNSSKGLALLCIIAFFGLVYIVMFYGFKLEKMGPLENGLFLIDKNTYRTTIKLIVANVVIFVVLLALKSIFVKTN